jgi:hypothetical protein
LRTGSFGNRDAESLISTLVEPKRNVLMKLRTGFLSRGYFEEAGYDPINVESYVSYSISSVSRFVFKHKWELAVIMVLQDQKEQTELLAQFPPLKEREFEHNSEDGTLWLELDPTSETEMILALADFYARARS